MLKNRTVYNFTFFFVQPCTIFILRQLKNILVDLHKIYEHIL